jgi:hypothetical protein
VTIDASVVRPEQAIDEVIRHLERSGYLTSAENA